MALFKFLGKKNKPLNSPHFFRKNYKGILITHSTSMSNNPPFSKQEQKKRHPPPEVKKKQQKKKEKKRKII